MKNIGFNTKENLDMEVTAKNACSEYLDEIFATTAEIFRFTASEQEKFASNEIARLMAAIPFVAGYEQSKDYDVEHNQYNPLNDGAWKYEELKYALVSDIKENPCDGLDTILPIEGSTRKRC